MTDALLRRIRADIANRNALATLERIDEAIDPVAKFAARISCAWPLAPLSIHGYADAHNVCRIRIALTLPDVRNPNITSAGVRTLTAPRLVLEQRPDLLLEDIRSQILELLEHELDEWLRFDGDYVRHPHPEDDGGQA